MSDPHSLSRTSPAHQPFFRGYVGVIAVILIVTVGLCWGLTHI
jgi:hypothetical protein